MVCKVCRAPDLKRARRRGFLSWLLRWFGLYPWRCFSCDKVRFYRMRRSPNDRTNTVDWMAS